MHEKCTQSAYDIFRLIGPLFFTTCWPRIEMCGASSFMRSFLVEVFTVIKVNLDLFKGKIAGKRATLRASGQLCGQNIALEMKCSTYFESFLYASEMDNLARIKCPTCDFSKESCMGCSPTTLTELDLSCLIKSAYLNVFPLSFETRIEEPATTTIELLEAVTTDIWSLNVETATHFLPKSEEWYRVFPDDA